VAQPGHSGAGGFQVMPPTRNSEAPRTKPVVKSAKRRVKLNRSQSQFPDNSRAPSLPPEARTVHRDATKTTGNVPYCHALFTEAVASAS
jgi:hypothetical protein